MQPAGPVEDADASSQVPGETLVAVPHPTTNRTRSTDRFRRQHEELQELGLAIAAKLSKRTVAAEASTVRRLVARFAGKLLVHASMENEALYPRLLAHSDGGVRTHARELFDEVGDLYAAFHGYAARWPSAASIEADPPGFVRETREILTRLAFRMVRESDELYPMVEKADDTSRERAG